jgi:hypothetical protein
MEQLVKGKNLDASKISFSAPKVLDNGAKLVYVNYAGGRFNVQTPWMPLNWNMSAYTEGPYPKYSAELSFKGMDENDDLQQFYDKFTEVQNAIIDGGVENSVAWFKKKKPSRETVEALFNDMIKLSRDKETGEADGKWPAAFRVKVPCMNGKWECKLYDNEKTQLPINEGDGDELTKVEDVLVKNTKVRAILQCVGLWIASGNYMCQWKLVKAECDIPRNASAHNFLPDSDGEDDDEDGDDSRQASTNASEPQMLDDSDDEVEDAQEEEEETVVVKSKKKIIKKKKATS